MRKLAALATITTAGAIAAVGLAGTASAYDGETAKGMITAPTSAYARPSIESEVLDQLDRNEEVDVLCVTTIAPIGRDPFDSPVWFKVGQSGTELGYVHISYTRPAADSPNVVLPKC